MATDFTEHLPSNLRLFARVAIAARRTRMHAADQAGPLAKPCSLSVEAAPRLADLDAFTADFDERIRVQVGQELIDRLVVEFGAKRVQRWLKNIAAVHGETL